MKFLLHSSLLSLVLLCVVAQNGSLDGSIDTNDFDNNENSIKNEGLKAVFQSTREPEAITDNGITNNQDDLLPRISGSELKSTLNIAAKASVGNAVTAEMEEMICRVNYLRKQEGKKPLKLDIRLMRAAQKHSQAQAEYGKMQHEGFTKATKGIGDRIKLEGLQWSSCAENVAYNQQTVEQVMNSWIKSKGHHANLVSDKINCFGYGKANKKGNYWTQNFAESRDGCQGFPEVDCKGKTYSYNHLK